MRFARLLLTLATLLPASIPYAQSGTSSSVGKRIAPGIEAIFSDSGRNSCKWRFRNIDPTRTLESMRFTYTWTTSPLSRVPLSNSSSNSREDGLTEPLEPFKVSPVEDLFQAPAACITVNITVTDSRWM